LRLCGELQKRYSSLLIRDGRYDIVLINPGTVPGHPHLAANVGLAALEAFLRQHGLRCRTIADAEVAQYLTCADVFGISVMDHTYARARSVTQRLAQAAKTVVWGGWTATALPEYILAQIPGVTYVILREGEQRLLWLLEALKQPDLFDRIDGIAYRTAAGQIEVRPPRGFLNLDDLPIPTELATLNQLVFVELARGCYGGCRYCQEVRAMRFKSAARALAEIQHWYDRGYRYFYWGNANSLANGALLAELTRALEARDLRIRIFLTGRPTDVVRHAAVLEIMFRSPILRIHSIEVGVEANTQALLDLLGRRATPAINRQALETLLRLRDTHSPDTRIHANMILFSHVDMTLADFVENVRFIGEYQCSREVMGLQLYGVAGTPLWADMRARGFPAQADRGLQIAEYPFTDPLVKRVFEKLVAAPLRQLRRNPGFSLADQANFQQQCHDRLLHWYQAPDIMARALDFIESETEEEDAWKPVT
jgi:tRNA A37 methylthiotransferase MiaB